MKDAEGYEYSKSIRMILRRCAREGEVVRMSQRRTSARSADVMCSVSACARHRVMDRVVVAAALCVTRYPCSTQSYSATHAERGLPVR